VKKNAAKVLKKDTKKYLNFSFCTDKFWSVKQLTLKVPSMYIWEAFLMMNKAVLEKKTVSGTRHPPQNHGTLTRGGH
jgi:hypothetical protein